MGYSVFFYGLDQIRGGNNGFMSLIIPGKFTEQQADNPASINTGKNAPGEPTGPVVAHGTVPGAGPGQPGGPGAGFPNNQPPPKGGGPVKSSPGSSTQGTGVYG